MRKVMMCENDFAIHKRCFFSIIEEVIMHENDFGKSVYMSDVFLMYYYILIILKSIFKSIKSNLEYNDIHLNFLALRYFF